MVNNQEISNNTNLYRFVKKKIKKLNKKIFKPKENNLTCKQEIFAIINHTHL